MSTRKLVDSLAEQEALEELVEGVKPPAPGGRVHYLLSTPFRYPPLPHGSRFGRADERGIWYGSESVPTALAETAYYRLLFLEGTAADLGTVETGHTAFRARCRAARGVDLTVAPFDAARATVVAPDRYGQTQELGVVLRGDGVQTLRYPSARDPGGGVNVAVLEVGAFGRSRPRGFETWYSASTRSAVEFKRRDFRGGRVIRFAREAFLVEDELPAPAA